MGKYTPLNRSTELTTKSPLFRGETFELPSIKRGWGGVIKGIFRLKLYYGEGYIKDRFS